MFCAVCEMHIGGLPCAQRGNWCWYSQDGHSTKGTPLSRNCWRSIGAIPENVHVTGLVGCVTAACPLLLPACSSVSLARTLPVGAAGVDHGLVRPLITRKVLR
jgi:hypothetical protein